MPSDAIVTTQVLLESTLSAVNEVRIDALVIKLSQAAATVCTVKPSEISFGALRELLAQGWLAGIIATHMEHTIGV